MKNKLLCALLALLLALPFGALAEFDFVLPTPQPTESPDNFEGALPTPQGFEPALSTPTPVQPLPNPADYFGFEGRLDQTDAQFGDGVYEVWYYQQNSHWNEYLKNWLDECEMRGYTWSAQKVSTANGYVVRGGGWQAILVPNYGGQVMLLHPQLMPMDKSSDGSMPELSKGDVAISINGRVYTLHDQSMNYWTYVNYNPNSYYNFTSNTKVRYAYYLRVATGLEGVGDIYISLPLLTFTAEPIVLNAGSNNDKYNLHINGKQYINYTDSLPNKSYSKISRSNRFEADSDQCLVEIVYNDDERIIGSFNGVFDSGASRITVAFDLPIE